MVRRQSRFGVLSRTWNGAQPLTRLLIGALFIMILGLIGQTPKSVFGVDIIWPHAALLGAAGWGMAGLSFRPMIVLILFGFAQDISFDANLGCFVLVNLTTYGLTAIIAESLDVGNDPLLKLIIPVATIAAGFLMLWGVASATSNQIATLRPLVGAFVMTLGLYYLMRRIFDLDVRPGAEFGRTI